MGRGKGPFNSTFLLFQPPPPSSPSPATNEGVCATHLYALLRLPTLIIYSICLLPFVCNTPACVPYLLIISEFFRSYLLFFVSFYFVLNLLTHV